MSDTSTPLSTPLSTPFSAYASNACSTRIIKTGTTIVGLCSDTCTILCADTRATAGTLIADKTRHKLHRITDQIYCAGAGTAADTYRACELASSLARIYEQKYLKQAPVRYVVTALSRHLFRYQGYISAALIVGGRTNGACQLFSVSPDGTVMSGNYLAMGSGSLAAMGIMEARYERGLAQADMQALAVRAVRAGILNDLYSGSNVDMVVIGERTDVYVPYTVVAETQRGMAVSYPRDSVAISKEEVFDIIEVIEE